VARAPLAPPVEPPLVSLSVRILLWVSELRYLYSKLTTVENFPDLHNAKCSFYRAANSIFGKLGEIASEEVVIELIIFSLPFW